MCYNIAWRLYGQAMQWINETTTKRGLMIIFESWKMLFLKIFKGVSRKTEKGEIVLGLPFHKMIKIVM